MRKRTVTIIEMHQIITVRRSASASLRWCPVCLHESEMVHLEGAALLAGVSLQDISLRVGAADLHFVDTADGRLVCLPSLLKDVQAISLKPPHRT